MIRLHLFSAAAFCLLTFSATGATPEENRTFLAGIFSTESDVSAPNLCFLQLLAEGKTFAEASAGKRSDPDTLATYESLTPEARKKLAVNFAGKIKNAEALEKLAGELAKEGGRKRGMSPDEARKSILASIAAMPDITAGNLLFLKGLAEGKSWDDASAGKRSDPDTLDTYKSLPADARKKLAANFAGKIKDPGILNKLDKDLAEASAPSKAPAANLDPKEARDVLIQAIGLLPDVGDSPPEACAGALLVLKALAEGGTMEAARSANDPDTLNTYVSLTPEARKKLAVNFAGKITDGAILLQLARQYTAMAGAFHKRQAPAAPAPPAAK